MGGCPHSTWWSFRKTTSTTPPSPKVQAHSAWGRVPGLLARAVRLGRQAAATIPAMTLPLIGVDFSSRPSRRKPIVMATGSLHGAVLRLTGLQRFETLQAFGEWLQQPAPWVGGFDLPFGLPRELVTTLGWPTDWAACMQHYSALSREQVRDTFAAFCKARPVGAKFAHRACDGQSGASPSMKWVNPPVAYMLHAGVPLLRAAGVEFPAHGPALWPADAPVRDSGHQGAPAHSVADGAARRVALEAYPGLLARELIGRRSYKSDDRAKQTPDRLIARKDIVEALEQGRTRLGLRLKLTAAQRDSLADDASGDALDAVLCLLQAGWAQRTPGWGLPARVDPLEGWIVSA